MSFTAEQIRAKSVTEVDIIGFTSEEPITIKLKTLSILGLISKGKIPNTLLGTAMELFEGRSSQKDLNDSTRILEMANLMEIICENAMVEPLFDEVADVLTDNQKMEIFYYTQGGLKSLETFRKKS